MRITFNTLRASVLVAAGALAMPAGANAAIISFDQIGGASGQVTTNADGSDFIGTNIRFDEIVFEGSSVYCDNTGELNTSADACWLNFNTATGEFVVTADSGLYAADGTHLFGDPGVTVLTGTGISFHGLAGQTTLIIEGTDTKLAELLEYFGLTSEGWNYSNTNINNPGGFPNGSTVNITSADIDNSDETIPEPGLLALFGLGLAGVGRHLARRRKNS